jgi:hypothetical protein
MKQQDSKKQPDSAGAGGGGSPRLPFQPRLRSLKSSRQTLARIVREWGKGTISNEDGKTAAWLLNMLLAYFKAAETEEFETRLQELDRKLSKLETERKKDHGQKFKAIS